MFYSRMLYKSQHQLNKVTSSSHLAPTTVVVAADDVSGQVRGREGEKGNDDTNDDDDQRNDVNNEWFRYTA